MLDRIRRNIARHISLSDGEFEFFGSLVQHRQLDRKGLLLAPGEVCRFEGFIDRGCVRVYNTDSDGFDHVLYFGPEGWWVADLHSFLTQAPASLGIEALEPTDALLLDRESKERLYAEVPQFERFFRILTQRALVTLQQRMLAVMTDTAEARYLAFRRQYPDLEERVPQYHIASYLGIGPECLSRIRRHLATRHGAHATTSRVLTQVKDRASRSR
jgi:CRP-like cAMP-binding protein